MEQICHANLYKFQGRKWADFQAVQNKMEVHDFLAWATKERKAVKKELEVSCGVPFIRTHRGEEGGACN